jgi:hypothetical protein
MEPNYVLTNILALLVPFGCYYLGIIVRKVALPTPHSRPWSHQFLLGVPTSMVVVSPLIPVLSKTLNDMPALLVTLGVIIEHGMVVNEAAADMLKRMRSSSTADAPGDEETKPRTS